MFQYSNGECDNDVAIQCFKVRWFSHQEIELFLFFFFCFGFCLLEILYYFFPYFHELIRSLNKILLLIFVNFQESSKKKNRNRCQIHMFTEWDKCTDSIVGQLSGQQNTSHHDRWIKWIKQNITFKNEYIHKKINIFDGITSQTSVDRQTGWYGNFGTKSNTQLKSD